MPSNCCADAAVPGPAGGQRRLVEVIFEIWRYAEQPCGKRLKPVINLWLGAYEGRHGKPILITCRLMSSAAFTRFTPPR